MALSADVQVLHMVSDLLKAEQLMPKHRPSAHNHLFRAMILLDYMVGDPKWLYGLRELLRLREAMGSLIFCERPYADSDQLIAAALQLKSKAYRALSNNS